MANNIENRKTGLRGDQSNANNWAEWTLIGEARSFIGSKPVRVGLCGPRPARVSASYNVTALVTQPNVVLIFIDNLQ